MPLKFYTTCWDKHQCCGVSSLEWRQSMETVNRRLIAILFYYKKWQQHTEWIRMKRYFRYTQQSYMLSSLIELLCSQQPNETSGIANWEDICSSKSSWWPPYNWWTKRDGRAWQRWIIKLGAALWGYCSGNATILAEAINLTYSNGRHSRTTNGVLHP